MFLTNLSLKRPVLATVTVLALVFLGILSYLRLNINDWPDIEFPWVSITIVQPGASPEQMETMVAHKLEETVGQISGVKHTYTEIQEGLLFTWVEFTLETPTQTAMQNVRDKLGAIRNELPRDIEEPVISSFEPNAAPIVSLALTGGQSTRELSSLVDELVKNKLETIPGVGAVKIAGQETREIQIELDKNKLASYGLSIAEIIASLNSHNLEAPGGSLTGAGDRMTLRTSGQLHSLVEFYEIPVARRAGVQLYLKDIATITDGIKEPENLTFYQGKAAVGISIIKQSGQNTVLVADAIKTAVEGIEKQLPPGVKINMVRDNSLNIRGSVKAVVNTLLEGSLLAVVMVFLFLRNWRTTLIGAVAIPTSIITTFLCMDLMGFTLNIMTLMALSLSVGLLIDDAIVVIENITRHLRMGKSSWDAARDATGEIGLAVLATTLTVVAVFLPVGMMTGQVAQFFKQFGITVVFSVLVSLFVSFTLVPLLSARFLDGEEGPPGGLTGRFLNWFNRGFETCTQQYLKGLAWSLHHRRLTLGLALALFAASLAAIPFMGTGFVPISDMGESTIIVEFDSGLSLNAAREMTGRAEDCIRSFPEVEKIYSTVETDQATIFVKIIDKDSRDLTIYQVLADMRLKLAAIPGIRASMLLNQGMGEEEGWQFRLQGPDLDQMQVYAEKAQHILESIPGVVDVRNSYKPGKPELKLVVKDKQAADLGVSTAQIAETVTTLFTGTVVGQYAEGEDRYDVRLRLQGAQRESSGDLNGIYLPSLKAAEGTAMPLIALNQVVDPVYSTSPNLISRSDRYKEIVLSGNLDGISTGEFYQTFAQRVQKEIEMPSGYRFYASGEAEQMDETFAAMFMALITGILFIFFILASQFESYIDPFSIMLALPMAIIGAIGGLIVTGSNLDMISMIGMIMLMGLVTKNAILLIDFTKQARQKGLARNEALMLAAKTRLRPIMMTSLAMIFGMMPMALALGVGSELRAPMAHAVIGGLITSTLLTLVVVPVIYSLLDDLKNRLITANYLESSFNRPGEGEQSG